jgi:hypothetical protein
VNRRIIGSALAAIGLVAGCSVLNPSDTTTTNQAPTVATVATATPNPVTGTTSALAVLGTDDAGESALIYTWAATTVPTGGTVTFSVNGTNAAKATTATFTKAGSYTLQATIKDAEGLTVTSSVTVVVSTTTSSINVHGTISHDTTWADTVHVDGDLIVNNAILTISRKTRILVDDDAKISVVSGGKITIGEGAFFHLGTTVYFEVGYGTAGTLIATGSDSLPITFTKSTGVQNWGYSNAERSGGIWIGSNATTQTALTHCIIEYATTGIFVEAGVYTISKCKIRNSSLHGIQFDGTDAGFKDSASCQFDTITGCASYPIHIYANRLADISATSGLSGNATGMDAIQVAGTDVTTSGFWKKLNVPYFMNGKSGINSAAGPVITIEPGTILNFNNEAYIEVGSGEPGTLKAIGTDAAPITFTKSTGVQNWGYSNAERSGGIWIGSKATTQTTLTSCIIEYATTGIFVEAGVYPISKCKIRNCSLHGIQFDGTDAGPKDSASCQFDTITGCGSYPIHLSSQYLGDLSVTCGLTGNATNMDFVQVSGSTVTKSGYWKKLNVPYLMSGTTSIGDATGPVVTIQPGTIFKFDSEAYIDIGSGKSGTIKAQGTVTDSIFFDVSATAATWGYENANRSGGIWIGGYATLNTSLQYCSIKNAVAGIFVETGAKVEISNCLVKNSKLNGMVFNGTGMPKDSANFLNNVITGSAEYGIRIEGNNLVKLSGTGSVAGNTLGGIFVLGEAVTQSGMWKKHDAPYIVDGTLDIGATAGVTITIQPGAQFRLVADAYIQVGYTYPATVLANGTTTDPIVFTGHVDGSFWGYDNSATRGGGIWFGNKATTITSFTYCTVEKATHGFFVDGPVKIQNCTIRDNKYYGMIIDADGATATVTPNTFSGNGTGDSHTL